MAGFAEDVVVDIANALRFGCRMKAETALPEGTEQPHEMTAYQMTERGTVTDVEEC